MNIVSQTGELVKSRILSRVKPKHQQLFAFGLTALSFNSFKSLNGNARQVVANIHTAHSKIYRLVSNPRVLVDFPQLVKASGLVTKNSLVNVDFSSFCGFETLAFGVQTGMGRAIPIWVNCLTYPIKSVGSQNLFVLAQVKALGKTLGFWPALVFDRGFVIPTLIKLMLEEKITFYLRVKAGQGFEWEDQRHPLEKRPVKKIGQYTKDTTITGYGQKLRLIVSPPPPPTRNHPATGERWYIITNDFGSSRKKILDIYRCRFEIEETFKDLKHVCDLKKLFIKKPLTFKVLLWFNCLAFWLAWWWKQTIPGGVDQVGVHPKKLRSWLKVWWETLQREVKLPQLQLMVSLTNLPVPGG